MTTARKASTSVSFNGTDISAIINKYLMSLSYVDNEEDETDDLQIKLEDRSGVWLQQWLQKFIEEASALYDTSSSGPRTTTANDGHAGVYKSVGKGSKTYDAALCQVYLIALGYLSGEVKVKADAAVVSAIKAFQKANNIAVKKKCDRKTWVSLVAAVNGKTIPLYDYTFKAKSKITLRASASKSAKKVVDIPKGSEAVVIEKVASKWYRVKYEGQSGFAKSSGLKLSSIDEASSATRLMRKVQITAKITREENAKKVTTDCGLFELDDIKASGPPSTVTIKASSLAYSGIRKTENDKSWECYTLRGIAEEIAGKNGLGVLFDADIDPSYDRIEQSKQTDIALLKKLCQDVGYGLKITDNQIVIYDQAKYEAMQEIATISFGDGSYTKWSLSTGDGQQQYDACEVSYTDPATGKAIKATVYTEEYKQKLEDAKAKQTTKKKKKKDDEKDEGIETLVVTDQRVTSIAEAEALAERLLKLNNKFEQQATFTLKGNPIYCAGMNIRLQKFGYWNGKYAISKAKHDITPNNGYTTTITLRKVDENAKPQQAAAKVYKVGDTVTFNGGNQYKSATAKKPSSSRRAGPAKVMKIKDGKAHPYKLQGGHYNKLDGDSNVNGYVDSGSFS